jgi:hypothetical protein
MLDVPVSQFSDLMFFVRQTQNSWMKGHQCLRKALSHTIRARSQHSSYLFSLHEENPAGKRGLAKGSTCAQDCWIWSKFHKSWDPWRLRCFCYLLVRGGQLMNDYLTWGHFTIRCPGPNPPDIIFQILDEQLLRSCSLSTRHMDGGYCRGTVQWKPTDSTSLPK